MVEQVGLHALVGHPFLDRGEAVDFDRNSGRCRLQVPYHAGEFLVDDRKGFQIVIQIGPEQGQIGQPIQTGLSRAVRPGPGGRFGFFLMFGDEVAHQRDFPVPLDRFGRAKAHAAHVDADRAHDASSAGLFHPPPVLERVAGQHERGDRSDRVVEVLDLHRVQRHFQHRPVHVVLRHADPVARLEHLIGRKHDARYEPEDRVLEDQHQDGGRCAQPGQGPSDDKADDDDASDEKQADLQDLKHSLERPVVHFVASVQESERHLEQGVEKHDDDDDNVDQTDRL